MPSEIVLLDSRLEAMCRSYTSGERSTRDLAKDYGLSYGTVRKALLSKGVELTNGKLSITRKATGRVSPMLGVKRTTESIEKQVATRLRNAKPARSGYSHSPETRAKISAATTGKNVKYSDEDRKRLESLRQVCKRFVRRTLAAKGVKKEGTSSSLLGYTPIELNEHLGMRPKDGEVDHIVPIVEFFRRGIHDVMVINALPNLRWLSSAENKRKSDTVPANVDDMVDVCLKWAEARRHDE